MRMKNHAPLSRTHKIIRGLILSALVIEHVLWGIKNFSIRGFYNLLKIGRKIRNL